MSFYLKKIGTGVLFGIVSIFQNCQTDQFSEGKNLYETHCQNCHAADGVGLGALIPPLSGADFLEKNREKLPCILTKGMAGEIQVNGKVYNEAMPGVPKLNAIEVTNILNFIGNSWGNHSELWKLDEVKKALENCR